MIAPRKVQFEAKKIEKENLEFRTYLKCNTDAETLDLQFAKLHKELFANYDCNRCRNCCKKFRGFIPQSDLDKVAAYLRMPKEQFMDTYLVKKSTREGYSTKHMPCDFLENDGSCKLGECKPESCAKYPFTDQPGRFESLYSMLEAVEVCPVAFEIFERLKKEYHFGFSRS